MVEPRILGFIGLGVMGEPMCRNMAAKSGLRMLASDLNDAPLQRLAAQGVVRADPAQVAREADIVFLSLPSGREVETVCRALLPLMRGAQSVVDLSTSPVNLARVLARDFAAKGVDYADAPVARTREAAEKGTLAIMVGAARPVFDRIRPILAHCASDISHCGDVGAGQMAKILNNMVLFQTVLALSEARAIGRRAGVDPALLFDTLSKGSADSFALRNHGMKAIVPGEFPERAFPVTYALKDLGYALRLAEDTGVAAQAASLVKTWFDRAIDAGEGARYFPVISRLVDD